MYEISPAKFEPLIRISRPVAPSAELIDCNLTLNIISCSEPENDKVTEDESVNPDLGINPASAINQHYKLNGMPTLNLTRMASDSSASCQLD